MRFVTQRQGLPLDRFCDRPFVSLLVGGLFQGQGDADDSLPVVCSTDGEFCANACRLRLHARKTEVTGGLLAAELGFRRETWTGIEDHDPHMLVFQHDLHRLPPSARMLEAVI